MRWVRTRWAPTMRLGVVAAAIVTAAATGGVAPPALAAGGPLDGPAEIGSVTAFVASGGADDGRLVLDVPVRYGDLSAVEAGRADEAVAAYRGALRLRVVSRRSGRVLADVSDVNALLLSAPGPGVRFVHRVELSRAATRRVLGARPARSGRIALRLSARGALNLDTDSALEGVSADAETQTSVPWRRVDALPEVAPPRCQPFDADVNHNRPEAVVVTCMGEGVDLGIASRPEHGVLGADRDRNGILRVTYRPDEDYVGDDGFTVLARTVSDGSVAALRPPEVVSLQVQPFKLRALGDSIASGWGIYSNAAQMSKFRLLACRPKAAPSNNACSANAPGDTAAAGQPAFLADWGLANGAAWPAQLARRLRLTGPGQFENRAVAGAHASDWDRGEPYRPQFDAVVADSPDLVVMSLGANPLLSTVLIGSGALCAALNTETMKVCVRRYVDEVGIQKHMANVLTDLVRGARNAHVVLALYHTAVPAISSFKYFESEWILEQVNNELLAAVRDAKARLGAADDRRLLVMRPPRFNAGMPLRDVAGNVIGNGGPLNCGSSVFTRVRVDGASRQAEVSQLALKALNPVEFCGSSYLGADKRPWTIEGDFGIHLSAAGAEVYAEAVLTLPFRRP